jgi:hypothetical protein
LPQEIQSLVPESAILNDLQSYEYRLDKILTDKKLRMRQLLTDPRTVCTIVIMSHKYLLQIIDETNVKNTNLL